MDNNSQPNVPFIVHEGIVASMERTIRRLWVLCVVMFLSLVISNALWICYESQFEGVVTTQSVTQDVTQDSNDGGSNVFVGGDYGEAESEENSGNY